MLEISLLGEIRVAFDSAVVVGLRSPRVTARLGFLLAHRDAPQRPKVWAKDPSASNLWGIMPGDEMMK